MSIVERDRLLRSLSPPVKVSRSPLASALPVRLSGTCSGGFDVFVMLAARSAAALSPLIATSALTPLAATPRLGADSDPPSRWSTAVGPPAGFQVPAQR